ncbi:MAG: TonB-dependent receptor [Alphaproteobacteria bacterium]|nr:TonB-dependent receptor [Alphaproteobacteria bacterium]
MNFTKHLAATSAVFLALAGASHANAAEATAAADAAASAGGLEEVVVTAEKRKENLQDTPISISVLSAAGIEDRNVYSLVDLGDGAIPSLKVAPFFSRPGALIMNIRGIGVLSDSNQPARDQGVGVYVDGVYMGRPQGLGVAMYDVESIEVLKGPQGTLFGRNTEGGAVQITTKKPKGEFGLLAKGGASSFSGYTGELHVDLPKFANFSVKLDGVLTGRSGWVDNPLPQAEDFGSYDKRALRARVLWEPTPNFTADYAFDTSYDATSTLYQQFLAPFPTATLKPAAANTASTSRIDTATLPVPQQLSVGNTWGHRLTADWRLSDTITIKSISSYRDLKQDQWDNGSAALSAGAFQATPTSTTFVGSQFGRYSLALFNQNQFSQEFQIIGDTERLKWVAGAIYYREHVTDNARAFFTSNFTDVAGVASTIRSIDYLAQRIDRASQVTTKSTGVFGQATYTPPILDDALHVTLGGRWTKDEKVGRMRTINGVNFPIGSQGQTFFAPSAPTTPLLSPNPMNASWDRFDPIVNVAYDVTEDFLIYAKYSTGYKSGGSNSRSLTYKPFDPETVEMMEIGAKTEFFDNRVRLNVAAYDGKYKDIQLDFSAPYLVISSTGALTFTNRTTTETINAPGEGKLSGFEADLTFAATDNLTLSASYAYNKVDIPATLNPFPQIDGRPIPVPIPIYQVYTPENSASFAIDYERPFMGAKIAAHLDGNYGDGYYANYTDVAYDPVTRAVTVKNPKGDSAFIMNGRLSLAEIPAGGGTATLSIWSRNLLDEEHVFAKFLDPRSGFGGFFNEPRTVGFEVAVKM